MAARVAQFRWCGALDPGEWDIFPSLGAAARWKSKAPDFQLWFCSLARFCRSSFFSVSAASFDGDSSWKLSISSWLFLESGNAAGKVCSIQGDRSVAASKMASFLLSGKCLYAPTVRRISNQGKGIGSPFEIEKEGVMFL